MDNDESRDDRRSSLSGYRFPRQLEARSIVGRKPSTVSPQQSEEDNILNTIRLEKQLNNPLNSTRYIKYNFHFLKKKRILTVDRTGLFHIRVVKYNLSSKIHLFFLTPSK